LSELVAAFVELKGIGPGDYLFQSRGGGPMHVNTARHRLAKHNIPGFHSMRRWRVSYLKKFGTPEQLLKFWIGHSSGKDITARGDTTARYDKSCDDREWCQTWANKCGIGFDLPELRSVGHPAPKSSKVFEPVASSSPQPAAAPKVSEALQPQPTYIAEDSDLDDFFHSTPELVPEEV
jgi:hypothetical protein